MYFSLDTLYKWMKHNKLGCSDLKQDMPGQDSVQWANCGPIVRPGLAEADCWYNQLSEAAETQSGVSIQNIDNTDFVHRLQQSGELWLTINRNM